MNDLGVAISDTDGAGEAPAENPAHAVVAEIQAAGGEAVVSTDSVATEAGGEAIVGAALDAFGRIDVLVNNAGVVRSAPFEDYADELLWPVLESQIGGHFHVTRPAWRAMQRPGLRTGAQPRVRRRPVGRPRDDRVLGRQDGDRRPDARALAQEGAAHGIAVNVDRAVREDAARRVRSDPGVAGRSSSGSRSTSSRRSRSGSSTRTARSRVSASRSAVGTSGGSASR